MKEFRRQVLWSIYNPIHLKIAYLEIIKNNHNLNHFYEFIKKALKTCCIVKSKYSFSKPEKVEFHKKFGWIIKTKNTYAFLGKIDISDLKVKLSFGRNSYISGPSKIYGGGSLSIGAFTCIGENFFCVTENDNHSFTRLAFINFYENKRLAYEKLSFPKLEENKKANSNSNIIIGNNVWIGRNVTIKTGSKIFDNSCIAESSLVRGDVPSFTIYGGVPAKKIKNITSFKKIKKHTEWWFWDRKKILKSKKLF